MTPFLNKLTAPNPIRYKHKTLSQLTVIVRGNTESAASDDDLSLPITITDLTADSLRTYQMEWLIHKASKKEYS